MGYDIPDTRQVTEMKIGSKKNVQNIILLPKIPIVNNQKKKGVDILVAEEVFWKVGGGWVWAGMFVTKLCGE